MSSMINGKIASELCINTIRMCNFKKYQKGAKSVITINRRKKTSKNDAKNLQKNGAPSAAGEPLSPWIWANCFPSLRDSSASLAPADFSMTCGFCLTIKHGEHAIWYGYVLLIYGGFIQQWPTCWLMSSGSYYPNLHKLGISRVNWEILMKTYENYPVRVCWCLFPCPAKVLTFPFSIGLPWLAVLKFTMKPKKTCLEDHFTARICRFLGSMLDFWVYHPCFWKCWHCFSGFVEKHTRAGKVVTFTAHGWGLAWFQCTSRACAAQMFLSDH